MAKGQLRSTREKKKPKQQKPKAGPAPSPFSSAQQSKAPKDQKRR